MTNIQSGVASAGAYEPVVVMSIVLGLAVTQLLKGAAQLYRSRNRMRTWWLHWAWTTLHLPVPPGLIVAIYRTVANPLAARIVPPGVGGCPTTLQLSSDSTGNRTAALSWQVQDPVGSVLWLR